MNASEKHEPPEANAAWCVGLPLTERRPLSPQEMTDLMSMAGRLRRLGIAVLLATVGTLALLFIKVESLPFRWDPAPFLLMMAVAVALLILRWLLLDGQDSPLRRARLLRRDFQVGSVAVFRGSLLPDPNDQVQQQMLKLGVLQADVAQSQEVEVLPASFRVWSAGGALVRPWVRATWSQVAHPPAFASTAAQWLAPAAENSHGVVGTGRRELSQAEREELRLRARRHWRRPLPRAAFLSLFLVFPVARALWLGRSPHLQDWSGGFLLDVWAVLADITLLWGVVQAQRLGRDLRVGCVRIVSRAAPNRVADAAEAADGDPGKQVLEWLPTSGRLWSEDGVPAAWRRKR